MSNAHDRAYLALAVAAREASDFARGIVGDLGTPMLRGERIKQARRLGMLRLTVLDRAVLAELSDGASWDEVALELGLTEREARARYERTWVEWQAMTPEDAADFGDFTLGLHGDLDIHGTAESIDAWWNRHAEPWDSTETRHPVTRALVDGEAPPSDR